MDLEVSEEALLALQGDLIPRLKIQFTETDPLTHKDVPMVGTEETEFEMQPASDTLYASEKVVVVVVPAAEDLNDQVMPTKYYVFVYLKLEDEENDVSTDNEEETSARIVKRAFLRKAGRRALKKTYLYNRLSKSLVRLNTKVNKFEHTTRGLVNSHGSRMLKQMAALKTVAKSAGLRMMYLPTMLVSTINVRSTPQRVEDEEYKKEKRSIAPTADSSAVIYAFQRIDGDNFYPGAEDDTPLMEPKSRKYEDDISEREGGVDVQMESRNETSKEVTQEEKVHDQSLQAKESKDDEGCAPVTWYSIFHHSVFGTPKLCQS